MMEELSSIQDLSMKLLKTPDRQIKISKHDLARLVSYLIAPPEDTGDNAMMLTDVLVSLIGTEVKDDLTK